MPKSKKRRQTNYQRIQARNRKDAVRDKNHEAVLKVYAEADPQRQEYPPLILLVKGEEPKAAKHSHAREAARRKRQSANRVKNLLKRQTRALDFNHFTEADRLEGLIRKERKAA